MNITRVHVPWYTHKPRTMPPRLILIHATRGNTTPERQYMATINHFSSVPDSGGWASTADYVVGAQGEAAQFRDVTLNHGSWSAGYGAGGPATEYGVDEAAIAIEVAQSAMLEPYRNAAIETLAQLVAPLVERYGIPLHRIGYWSQRRSEPIPTGFIGHEDTANGKRTGKSDPGPLFPWRALFDRVAEINRKEEPVTLSKPLTVVQRSLLRVIFPGSAAVPIEPTSDGRNQYRLVLPK